MSAGGLPTPDFTDILPDDTRMSWLQRTDLAHYWRAHSVTGEPIGTALPGDPESDGYYWLRISESQFQLYKARLQRGLWRPVWPGLDAVVLGTPVALADGLTVVGPLHGVLVDCTTPPPGASEWILGSQSAYYRWGEVAFVTDNGEAEAFQWLAFGLGVYLPLSMALAQSAVFRVTRLPAAMVVPFTIP
jgi:hypothetical protein